jgi:hypothetical protein
MSQRIGEILSVVREVRSNYHPGMSLRSVKSLRDDAVEKTATRRGIYPTTVSNKFRRELYPDVSNTDEFDRLLETWLRTGDRALRSVLLKHAVDRWDEIDIRRFFSEASSESAPA